MKKGNIVTNYFDKYGRLHHKPCIDGEPSSNNGWIYTAYAAKVGVSVDKAAINDCYDRCVMTTKEGKFYLYRNPEKVLPPISRDEILGMASLEELAEYHLNGWNFAPYLLPKFSLIKFVKQLYQLRPTLKPVVTGPIEPDVKGLFGLYIRHRNYIWKNKLDQLYRVAFSVPLTDRHFILKCWGNFQWYNPAHLFYAAFAKVDQLVGKEDGISFLKYGTSAKEMAKEFPADHPIRSRVWNLS